MTNRLSKWSRQSSRIVCALAACGLMYACTDDFILDDEKPSWLTSSIYQSLEQRGNFRTYLKLLADKDVNIEGARSLVDVLNRTGSKTVFVANDSAWDAFFKANALLPESNPWHNATSYDKLSQAQKKLLIHTSMLNNAIVMENLASSQSNGTDSPVRGEYMRRYTDYETTDSVTYLHSDELPKHYSKTDKDYWARFRSENGGNGLYLINDSSLNMMLHFTAEHMAKNTFDEGNDFTVIMNGRTRNTSDVHIYDALLLQKDGVCENGYVNVTEKPLCPLPNMAEAIRTNGKTNIFSHILDRFSAPFYCPAVTRAYRTLHSDTFSETDSIFTKRYFSDNNYSVKGGYVRVSASTGKVPLFEPGPKGTYQAYNPTRPEFQDDKSISPSLKFDPGWNGYYDEVDVRKDMAAMFVPSDEQMWHYFTESGGADLILTYYAHEGEGADKGEIPYVKPATVEQLYEQIDCIPLGTIQALVKNMMQKSFVGSIPSKWDKLVDDALEPLFDEKNGGKDAAVAKVQKSILCSNGVVYVMDYTCAPADYRAVTAPAYISNTNTIMNKAIYESWMNLNYYAYLKAMQSKFTFLLPSNDALGYYYDPVSMKSASPRCIKFSDKNASAGQVNVDLAYYRYIGPYNYNSPDQPIGSVQSKIITGLPTQQQKEAEVKNRLKDILESHTIVHDGTNPMTRDDDGYSPGMPMPQYYLSKNGNAIKVVRDERDSVIAVKGGFQLENERAGIIADETMPGVTECTLKKAREMDNGHTYVLNAPLIPTYRSVYSILTDDSAPGYQIGTNPPRYDEEKWAQNPYREFYELCTSDGYSDIIVGCGLVDAKVYTTKQKRDNALEKFKIFTATNKNGLDFNVQFFNNYRYTAFIPTNDAVLAALDNGLPKWEEIKADYDSHLKPEIDDETGEPRVDDDGNIIYTQELATAEDSIRIATKITYLTNFIRYHFADNSVFADYTRLEPNEMVTSSYDSEKGLFLKIHVDRPGGGIDDLRVTDDLSWKSGGMSHAYTIVGEKNVLARDVECSAKPTGTMNGVTLNASSAAVIHQIDGTLNHIQLVSGSHAETLQLLIDEAVKEYNEKTGKMTYLKRYAIR